MKLLLLVATFVVLTVAVHAHTFKLSGVLKMREEPDPEEIESAPVPADIDNNLFISTCLNGCSSAKCEAACHALGYKHGKCASSTTCECYN